MNYQGVTTPITGASAGFGEEFASRRSSTSLRPLPFSRSPVQVCTPPPRLSFSCSLKRSHRNWKTPA